MTVAALLRVSTKDQDEDRQRADLLRHCEDKKIVIPAHLWFIDHESRDRADFRPAFQRMLELIEKGKITTVLIQTFDRFGVSDEIEFFHYHHLFRKAGCKLYSLRQGDLFLKDVSTVVQNLFRAKASEEEITQKSLRGLDGTVNKARQGKVMGSVPAYGYDKAVYAEDGRLLWTAHYLTRSHAIIRTFNAEGRVVDTRECRGKKQLPKRGKAEETRWLESTDKSRVELVQCLFRTFTTETITTRQLAVRLNREGYRIYGRPLTHAQVEKTLQNPCYLGQFAYNRTSQAHRQEVVEGRVVEVSEEIFRRYKYDKKITVRQRRREEWITKDGVYPRLIEDAEFCEAQRRLATRSRLSLPPRKGDRWLKGLLICGGCGKQMAVKLKVRTREVSYICRTYQASHHRHGENQSGCGRHTISHKDAVALIGELNYDIEFFFAEHEINLENALFAIAPSFRGGHTPSVDEVKEIEAGLEERGVGILDAVAADVEVAQRLLPQKRAEYEKWIKAKVNAGSDRERQFIAVNLRDLEAEITSLEEIAAPMDIKEQAIQHFRTLLREVIKASDTTVLSDKLRRTYSGIVLQFRHEQVGRRMKSCVIPEQTRFELNPNSWPRRGIGSPCVPPSQTVPIVSTSACRSSTPARGRRTSRSTNCRP